MKYYRLTEGLNNVGKFIPENENPYDHVSNQDKDWYLSIYKYTEEHKNAASEIVQKEKDGKKYKRPRGVVGIKDVLTTKLVFDTDSETDIERARLDAVEIYDRLVESGVNKNDINLSFSGGKGFSVVVSHDKEITPEKHKAIATKIAKGLDTWDTSVYNASRIFRLDYTKHNKSGLYKTPLSISQLRKLEVPTLKKQAEKKPTPKFEIKQTKLPEDLYNIKLEEEKKKEAPRVTENKALFKTLDFTKKPSYLTDLKYALHKGFIPPGRGNEGMMILCSTYKYVGFDKIDAYHMLKAVNEKRSEIYGIDKRSTDDIWLEVVQTVYANDWQGGTYSTKDSPLLAETAEAFGINEDKGSVDIHQVKNRFMKFATNINKNVVKTGIKSLDDTVMITTGMMVGILGAPGAGKTSLVSTVVENLSKNDQNVLFLSLDMHDNLLYSRILQRVTGLDIESKLRSTIESDATYNPEYSMNDDSELEGAFEEVADVYKNVDFDFTRGCTIESIEENIKNSKSKHGDDLKVVVVDYLEKVRGPFTDATANSGYVASRLSDLSSTYDVAILLLLQPQKSAGDCSEELLSMRKVKGASIIEQDCRAILTLWRPGFSPKNPQRDRFASIAVVKNNMGPVKQVDFSWNGKKGEIKELTNLEADALRTLINTIASEKEEEKKDGSGWGGL